jgi:CRISPR-associated protein Cmr1
MAAESLTVTLRTLTPIWTGGVETGKMDRLHETGLIGSLRWWYEAIVRGLGGSAYDPSEHSCVYDPEKPNNGLCDVCQLFGATGWRRRFRLVVEETKMQPQPITHPMKADRSYRDKAGKTRIPTWYFQNPPLAGDFTLKLRGLAPKNDLEVVQGLIQLATDWTALGARTQMGFGVVELGSKRFASNPFRSLSLSTGHLDSNLPSLQNMFFARVQKEGVIDRDTFDLKYDLRRLFADDPVVRHFVMGTVQGERIAAKIHMSRPYGNNFIRVWGWLPEEVKERNTGWNRNKVLHQISSHLSRNYHLVTWREFNSAERDTDQRYTDIQAFLSSLWEGRE